MMIETIAEPQRDILTALRRNNWYSRQSSARIVISVGSQ